MTRLPGTSPESAIAPGVGSLICSPKRPVVLNAVAAVAEFVVMPRISGSPLAEPALGIRTSALAAAPASAE